mgnify:CR=1 FL=1
MIILVFVSFLLIGITTSFQIRENSFYYHELRLDRKESQLQRAFKILFNEKSKQPDNQLSYLFSKRPEFGINISTVLDAELKDEIFNLGLAESDDVVERFIENQDRDNDDRARYSSLYGFDYGNLDGYDIVINTTNKEADLVFKEVVSELEKSGFRTN